MTFLTHHVTYVVDSGVGSFQIMKEIMNKIFSTLWPVLCNNKVDEDIEESIEAYNKKRYVGE